MLTNKTANAKDYDFDLGDDDFGGDDWGGDDWNLDEVKDNKAKVDIHDPNFQHMNLNKLGDDELKAYKAEMDKDYKKHYVDPKDPTFVYDKRVEFPKQGG